MRNVPAAIVVGAKVLAVLALLAGVGCGQVTPASSAIVAPPDGGAGGAGGARRGDGGGAAILEAGAAPDVAGAELGPELPTTSAGDAGVDEGARLPTGCFAFGSCLAGAEMCEPGVAYPMTWVELCPGSCTIAICHQKVDGGVTERNIYGDCSMSLTVSSPCMVGTGRCVIDCAHPDAGP